MRTIRAHAYQHLRRMGYSRSEAAEHCGLTEQHLDMARSRNACDAAMRRLKPGMALHEVTVDELQWFAARFPAEAEAAAKEALAGSNAKGLVPLALLGYGSGSGSGYGDDCGSGYGDDCGSGYGRS